MRSIAVPRSVRPEMLYCEHLQTVKYRNPADWEGKTEK